MTACESLIEDFLSWDHGASRFDLVEGQMTVCLSDTADKDTGEDPNLNTYFVLLNITGKFGMSMGFCIIYIWSAEIFPTSLRTTLMGLSSLVARGGQILAPLIADLVYMNLYISALLY